MENTSNTPLANHHISVDCVVIGFDGQQLKVLLLKRTLDNNGSEQHDMKLPGSLIYQDEDLDDAAKRVLRDQAGIRHLPLLVQFKAFGSKDRTKNKADVVWLEHAMKMRVERIVTIAYLSMERISPDETSYQANGNELCWVEVDKISSLALAFDHNNIVTEAMKRIREYVEDDPKQLFRLLPQKFTALQLRLLYERIYEKSFDVRNFQKKINQIDYIVPLEEKQKNVAHRAARLYRFDKVAYNKTRR